jgi:hypothetical protein
MKMTFVPEHEKQTECSCCGKEFQHGDGCITYDSEKLTLTLGSCCAFYVLSSLIQDADMAMQSPTSEIWVKRISGNQGEKLRRVAEAATRLAENLRNWAEVENNHGKS